MTDLFDRVAAQALGLGLTLRPRARSRFEPEANLPEADISWRDPAAAADVATAHVAMGTVAPPAADGSPTGEPAPHRDATPAGVPAANAPPAGGAAPAEALGEAPTVPVPRRSIQPDTPRLAATAMPPPRSAVRRSPDLSPRQQVERAGGPIEGGAPAFPGSGQTVRETTRSDLPAVRTAPRDTRLGQADPTNQPAGTLMPPEQSPDDTAPRGPAPAATAAGKLQPTIAERRAPTSAERVVSANTHAGQPTPSERRGPTGGERMTPDAADRPAGEPDRQLLPTARTAARRAETMPARPTGAGQAEPRPQPTIEITIGRLEIRAETAVAPRPAKPFQPHLDLAAYRAARERGQ